MDFELNKTQKGIQKAVRDFVKGEFNRDLALTLEKNHEFPKKQWEKACSLGLIGVHFDEKYSGQGLGIMEDILVIEELCRGDSTLGSAIALSAFASELILHYGSENQKMKYLPEIVSGKILSSGAFTEPDHGSDITYMDTTAIKDEKEWVINGTKTFITNGGMSGYYIVLCQTNLEATPGYRGQSIILVEADRKGISTSDVGEKMGIKMMATAEVNFNNVRVPLNNIIGEENRGFYNVLHFFDESRIQVASQALGIAQGAYDRALSYIKKRTQFGKKIVEFQVNQHKLAEMATKIELARLITYKAAWNFDKGRIDPKLTSMAKMYSGKTAVEVCDECIQLLGGYGYITEYEVERFYRDAKITEIYEGTKEIQKNTISSSIVGKIK